MLKKGFCLNLKSLVMRNNEIKIIALFMYLNLFIWGSSYVFSNWVTGPYFIAFWISQILHVYLIGYALNKIDFK